VSFFPFFLALPGDRLRDLCFFFFLLFPGIDFGEKKRIFLSVAGSILGYNNFFFRAINDDICNPKLDIIQKRSLCIASYILRSYFY
jgi:hypothetical protein